ncbi:Fur family transcriptional regulator [Desulfurobacterium atlanticum]|uniref:Fur family transcriptional regulator, peroxide stress response regulator n=1 Tax=Desulfurobacterium atlanticum TaxID=240169 RepID=A0A238ZR59_9BACT|nr:transcriptional repressor [Desulfurobacterium atlanticum]SNR85830.1 Fur family transcriptional regulator, peroxide stress response regulator [Desulfurobacterium atlanticum]
MEMIDKLVERFKEITRAKGLKVTPQRVAIYRELVSRYDHPSAEEIYEALKNKFAGISLATVYRTLTNLEKIGLAQKVATVNGIARFDGNVKPHSHFICTECGRVIDIDCKVEIDTKKLEDMNLCVEKCEFVCYGICDKCQH